MSVGLRDASAELRDDFAADKQKSDTPSYEIVGPADAPVVVVLGGISASRHVTSSSDSGSGWWDSFVGKDKTIDTNRFRVFSIDYSAIGVDGQALTTHDQALALGSALDAAGIESVRAIIGASYGGMVALAFAVLAPQRVDHLVVIGAAHESAPMSTALRILQRRIVELGVRTGRPHDAVVIARGLAMTTYSTAADLSERIGIENREPPAVARVLGEFLEASGETFARTCSAERFLAMSQSLDLHRVRPEDIRVSTTLIAVEEDILVPVGQIRELARRIGGLCRIVVLRSRYGHDTFLSDPNLLAPHVRCLLSSSSVEISCPKL